MQNIQNPDIKVVQSDVERALDEDMGTGDLSAQLIPGAQQAIAHIISREPMLVCGQWWAELAFKTVDAALTVEWHVKEGVFIDQPTTLCTIRGPSRAILTAERTALNFLQTLSATATQTHRFIQRLQGTSTQLLDTRKTLPGLRVAQKYAVACGGGVNHRMGLYDAFLIKENHIKACGSITKAVHLAKQRSQNVMVEVEVETLTELQEALRAGPDRIMLDNFTLADLKAAVTMNKPYQCALEASGNVSLDTIHDMAETGVDFISVGSITKSIKAIDLSLLMSETIAHD